jgi:hypothetical protein
MRAFICLAFLGMALLCRAQKTSKNEFSVGYFTAGYFFDSTSVKISKFVRGKNITLSYTRSLNKHLFLNATYVRWFSSYVPKPEPEFLAENSIITRYLKMVSGSIGYRISKWGMSAKAKAGVSYRFAFEKAVHFTYFNSGNWNEPREGFYAFKSVGTTLGLTVSHPIVWRFFGEFDCEYARIFSKEKVDQNQLLLSYRVGIRF